MAFFLPLNEGLSYLGLLLIMVGSVMKWIKEGARLSFVVTRDLPIFIFLFFGFLSSIFSKNSLGSFLLFLRWVGSIGFIFYLSIYNEPSGKAKENFLKRLLLVFNLSILVMIPQVFFGYYFRGTGLYEFLLKWGLIHVSPKIETLSLYLHHYPHLPRLLSFFIPFFCSVMLFPPSLWMQILSLFQMGLLLAVLGISLSRSGYLAILFSLCLIFGIKKPKYLLIFIILILCSSLLLPDYVFQRAKSIFHFQESSIRERILVWKDAFHTIRNRPVFGVGLGEFRTEKLLHSHNLLLNIGVEMGIPAALSLLFIIFQGLKNGFYKFKNQDVIWSKGVYLGFTAGVFALMIDGQFCYGLFGNQRLLMFFWFILSLLFGKKIDKW